MKSRSACASCKETNGHFLYPAPVKDFVEDEKQSDNKTGPFVEADAIKWTGIHKQHHNNCQKKIQYKFEYIHNVVYYSDRDLYDIIPGNN